ncbi:MULTISPECIES: sugar ABC transporter ATP-binding protein [unclassified Aeromicrobium]|uniref:sugar ABC transporter ATP-binding protein n=1 Tax=unclassified Aeromicrobium TaxID=2633570 RepID=UPI0009EC146F|nr:MULTISPECIES: sugar ABC transporter ATP-binding protein [unclassified Aeromicrobium]
MGAPVQLGHTDVEANVVLRGITKSFVGVQVLKGVDLSIAHGEIHGLLGQNGSGKSTLIKVLSGTYDPDGGEVLVEGDPQGLPLVDFAAVGFSFVHQDLGLIEEMTVLDNFLLPQTARSGSYYLRWRRDRARVQEVLERHGLHVDTRASVASLEPTDRALLAIVRAVHHIQESDRRGLLVLDEPTVFLPREGVERLFALVRSVASKGTSVLFVSHDIDEVRELTSHVTVLRDGAIAGTAVTAEVSDEELVTMIVGQQLARHQGQLRAHDGRGDVVLGARSVRTSLLDGIDIEVREGEVLGVTGLNGSGFEHVPYALFGALSDAEGTVRAGGVDHDLSSFDPRAALSAGMAFVPGDRKREGAVGDLTLADNITMQAIDRHRPWMLRRDALRRDGVRLIEEYDVRPARPEAMYGSLSGGNQQKALMAKWLTTEPDVLLLHEPTQGVDVGAREQIFAALDAARERRTAVVCASSDCEQLARICDRVVVVARGRIAAELSGDAIEKDHLVEQVYNTATITEPQHQHEGTPA